MWCYKFYFRTNTLGAKAFGTELGAKAHGADLGAKVYGAKLGAMDLSANLATKAARHHRHAKMGLGPWRQSLRCGDVLARYQWSWRRAQGP